jgi:hypothetical protein
MKSVYLLLSILGTVLPLSQFYGFLVSYGFNFSSFFEQLFINKVSSFFALDVLVSTFVVIIFIQQECRKRSIYYYWVAYVGLFLAGVSSGLPLFLYLRERGGIA